MMHINTLHSVLKKAGLKRQQRASTGLVRGYHPVVSDGYTIHERKADNPEWMGIGWRKRLPKYLPTGIYEIDPGPYGAEIVKLALVNAGIVFHHIVDERCITVDSSKQEVE